MIEQGTYYRTACGAEFYVYQIDPERNPMYPVRARCSESGGPFTKGVREQFTLEGRYMFHEASPEIDLLPSGDSLVPPKVGHKYRLRSGCIGIVHEDDGDDYLPMRGEIVGVTAEGPEIGWNRDGSFFELDNPSEFDCVEDCGPVESELELKVGYRYMTRCGYIAWILEDDNATSYPMRGTIPGVTSEDWWERDGTFLDENGHDYDIIREVGPMDNDQKAQVGLPLDDDKVVKITAPKGVRVEVIYE